MCFLFQALLLVGASATAYLVSGLAHGPIWLGGIASFIFLGAVWFGYLLYQAKHPDWWPPWDEGLPQEMRMLNVFVPVAVILVLGLIMVPVFQKARQKAAEQRMRTEQKLRAGRVSEVVHSARFSLI